MRHPLGEIVLVVPEDGRAAGAEQQADLESALTERDLDHRRVTPRPGESIEALVARETSGGDRLLVACGDQSLLVDVVRVVLGAPPEERSNDLVVGVFPGGSSNDFAKTYGLDTSPGATALLLSSDRVMRVDVGVATVTSGEDTAQHLVVNDAVVGLGAEVCRRQHRRLGRVPRVGPLGAWWSSLASYRTRHFDVDMTFAEWHDDAVQVRIANGQFAHEGLHVSPLALPDDGAWDVQVWDGPVHLPFTLQPKMLLGEHLPHEHISQWRQKRVEVTTSKPTGVAVDGRYVGTTPATFTLRPGLAPEERSA